MEESVLVAAILQILPRIIPIITEEVVKAVRNMRISGNDETDRTDRMEERMDRMEKRQMEWNEGMEKDHARVEDQNRRSNLIFLGLQPCAPEDVPLEVLKYVNQGLKIQMNMKDIVRAHYLGKSSAVICKFVSFELRQRVYAASYGKPYGVGVKEDFCKRTKRVREILGPKYRGLLAQARANNSPQPKFIADRIFHRGDTYTVHEGRGAIEIVTRDGAKKYVSFSTANTQPARKHEGKKKEDEKRERMREEESGRPAAFDIRLRDGGNERSTPTQEKGDSVDAAMREGGEDDAAAKGASGGGVSVNEKMCGTEKDDSEWETADEGATKEETVPWRRLTTPNKRTADGSPSPRSTCFAKLKQYRFEENSDDEDQEQSSNKTPGRKNSQQP